MKNGRAFEFDDLTVLLGLKLDEPADQGDIETIEIILARRRAADSLHDYRNRPHVTLHLVPGTSS